MADDAGARPAVDTATPNVARVWDYLLGGKDNFEADRAAADALSEVCLRVGAPDGRAVARENRAFIGRAVRYLAGEAGIDQFIDLGSGLPTRGNVHEVAQQVNPLTRTVYIDYDPVVLAHGRALLADNHQTVVIEADVRKPESIFSNRQVRRLLDLDRPVAVLLVAMLHLIPDDDDAEAIVLGIREAIAPGSYLALTHTTSEHRPDVAAELAKEFDRLHITTPLVPRDAAQIQRFFAGFQLVDPGLVSPPRWRPDEEPQSGAVSDTEWMYAGVARLSTSSASSSPPRRSPAREDPSSSGSAAGRIPHDNGNTRIHDSLQD